MPDKPARLPGLRYWTSPSTGMDFVYIAPGTFMMGSPKSERGRPIETQHEVTITKGFWLGVTEVTQGQWRAVMESNPSEFKGRSRPVEQVTRDKCSAFIVTLCEKEGVPPGTYRLPTEAEWEFSCRAGTTGPFAGNLDDLAWYEENSKLNRLDLSAMWKSDWSQGLRWIHVHGRSSALVGQKKANAWGLFDMHGNVWEWCYDFHGNYPLASVADPTGPDTGLFGVIRGGSADCNGFYCRSAWRDRCEPSFTTSLVGFRLLRLDSSFPTPR